MDVRKIRVIKVGRPGATGTPEEFEQHFERKEHPRARAVHKPTLTPIGNRPMSERLRDFNLGR